MLRSANRSKPSILVLGAENPRIRDLFRAVRQYAAVSFVDIKPISRRPSIGRLAKSWHWRMNSDGDTEATLLAPRRWHNVESAMLRWFCRRSISRFGMPDLVVFTWPQLAPLAEWFTGVHKVYYCKDPFEFWSWDPEIIRSLETRLLNNVDAVFAVSRALAEDFQPRTPAKVFYHPNGVEDCFIKAHQPRPANLPTGKTIVGSVGQINVTYDWEFIGRMTAAMPDVLFCFVGEVVETNPF
jgi:hypothetical protein